MSHRRLNSELVSRGAGVGAGGDRTGFDLKGWESAGQSRETAQLRICLSALFCDCDEIL